MTESQDLFVCRNKRCKHRGALVFPTTNGKCLTCNSQLRRAHNNEVNKPNQILLPGSVHIDLGDKPVDVYGNPLEGEAMKAWRDLGGYHYTFFNNTGSFWECWCGEFFLDGREAALHDSIELRPDGKSNENGERIRQARPSGSLIDISKAPQSHRGGGGKRGSSGSETWSCDADLKGCPIALADKPKILIPNEMFTRWIWLTKMIDTEWIAFLKGHLDLEKPNTYHITDMYFPTQKAHASHVEAEDGQIVDKYIWGQTQPGETCTIAAVHSHVGMNVFFSKEDEEHMTHPVEMVVNRDSKIASSVRVKLECGRFSRVDGLAMVTGTETDRLQLTELKGKLTEKKGWSSSSSSSSSSSTSPSSQSTDQPTHSYASDNWTT